MWVVPSLGWSWGKAAAAKGSCNLIPAPGAAPGHSSHDPLTPTCADGCCYPKVDLLSLLLSFQSSFLGNILPPLFGANHTIENERDAVFRKEAVEDKEQALHLAFRVMGKDLGNLIRRAIKACVVLFGKGLLPELALNLESRGSTLYPPVPRLLH